MGKSTAFKGHWEEQWLGGGGPNLKLAINLARAKEQPRGAVMGEEGPKSSNGKEGPQPQRRARLSKANLLLSAAPTMPTPLLNTTKGWEAKAAKLKDVTDGSVASSLGVFWLM